MKSAVMSHASVEPAEAPTLPVTPRGEVSATLLDVLLRGADPGTLENLGRAAGARTTDAVRDDDVQLSLFLLYALSYGTFDQLGAEHEWSPELVRLRTDLEKAFEAALREQVLVPPAPEPRVSAVADALFTLTAEPSGPSLAKFVARRASHEQIIEMLVQRSVYTLREADPHTWAVPRLTGRAKAALVEIQADEYGGGHPDRVHQHIYAATLRGTGLSAEYGAYVDHVPAITLASFNLMSMFGLNRRFLGAIVGHLAAYEMTASIPCRLYADGMRRHGMPEEVTHYFDEHVEADAVHEQIAARDLAGALAEDRPELTADIMFGAAACLAVDGAMGDHMLRAWKAGESSLLRPLAHDVAA
ncbi:Iron-containing redox enzyme [Georgenia satyanarayanai]|uniref:Iron-containing redox enzyme n=2 Tax=Georgenia satyanarayanai TaxID=860221 RepID=A0A2Y9BZ94_9MICO|nr:iron-containing redox enzyme family protein [Georgenia satyanarayanai]PYF99000.1 heme oxygenase-like protein [Georgenia satyanarayanai]SSA43962.1 Iron-containing redox enzyme [Georgenia satyanarayanai]